MGDLLSLLSHVGLLMMTRHYPYLSLSRGRGLGSRRVPRLGAVLGAGGAALRGLLQTWSHGTPGSARIMRAVDDLFYLTDFTDDLSGCC